MLPLLFLSLLIGVGANLYECPNNVTCIEKETCCQTTNGLWACCPIEDGVCCNDGLHCCSKGQKCSLNGICSSSTNEISFALPLRNRKIPIKSVQCSDGSSCPDDSTCCELPSGQYGCCPILNATCCQDHIHCCPQHHECDQVHFRCKRKISQSNEVVCPDSSYACPDDSTCCQLQSGDYGCCQYVDAVCCSDGIHCCPQKHICDVEHGECIKEISIPWFKKTVAFRREQELIDVINDKESNMYQLSVSSKSNDDIICPDAKTLCPSTSTCCLASATIWGCCPIEDAVCCSDGKHCCPTHYKCDLHVFKCNHDLFGSIPILKKEAGFKKILSTFILSNSDLSLSTIQCPDERSYCPEETTCCELTDGEYGCCPYSQATCCSDKIHCCDNGYSCDISGKNCIRRLNLLNETDIIPSRLKLKSLKKTNKIQELIRLTSLKDETCSDGKTKCSPNSTCCPNKQNDQITYSCCPYSKGVCCGTNGSVCCPNDYICDEKQLSCQLRDVTLVLRQILTDVDYYQCGTSDFSCSYDQTCCHTHGTRDEEYACCDLSQAQCCADGQHCCPKGTKCDMEVGGCISN